MYISLYAGLLSLFFLGLSIYVIKARRKFKVSLNEHNNDLEVRRRIRAHANFAEYTPIFLIMLGLSEYNGLSLFWVHLLGVLFLIGRISHAYSILFHELYEDDSLVVKPIFRIAGMMLSFFTILILSVVLLIQFFLQ